MKTKLFLPAIIILFSLLSAGCSFWGLALTSEADDLVGLWVSDALQEYDGELCYWDFRSNGQVYLTDWTEDIEAASVPGVPDYFSYNVRDDVLTLTQMLGIMKYEFEISEYIEGSYYLYVVEASGPLEISAYDSRTLTRVFEYSREAEAVRAAYPEAWNE